MDTRILLSAETFNYTGTCHYWSEFIFDALVNLTSRLGSSRVIYLLFRTFYQTPSDDGKHAASRKVLTLLRPY